MFSPFPTQISAGYNGIVVAHSLCSHTTAPDRSLGSTQSQTGPAS